METVHCGERCNRRRTVCCSQYIKPIEKKKGCHGIKNQGNSISGCLFYILILYSIPSTPKLSTIKILVGKTKATVFYPYSDSIWLTVSYDETFTYHKLGCLVNSVILSSKNGSLLTKEIKNQQY